MHTSSHTAYMKLCPRHALELDLIKPHHLLSPNPLQSLSMARLQSRVSGLGTWASLFILWVMYALIPIRAEVSDDVMQDMRIPHGVKLSREDTYVCTTGECLRDLVCIHANMTSPGSPMRSEAAVHPNEACRGDP